ncbi:uncharacterized protein LOC130669210 [Microplitis mediator]|uniref:uncharacterized protein LOC130669210 n=1 Tax=Microplitis mediator TaxID=375433 RepID=UPI002552CC45|nr:uncharacterized protein LOC130669210 [Microplitis mediator]
MSIIYLEKYTVAPAPSRDYCGIKIFANEIKIYHWRVSYGPHKYPSIRTYKFNEWSKNLSQDIEIIFGKSVVRSIDNIINKKYLLTLPQNFIYNLLKYLSINDIKNFCLLSRAAYQIIKDEVVKELVVKKLKIDNNKPNKSIPKDMAYSSNRLLAETNDIDKKLFKNPRIKGSNTEIIKTPYQKFLSKPQVDFTRTVSWDKNLKNTVRGSVSDNSIIKNNPANLPRRRVNVINVPSTEEINNKDILVDVNKQKIRTDQPTKSRGNGGKNKIQAGGDYKFLKSNKKVIRADGSSDLSALRTNDINLDELAKKTIDEYKKSRELIDCKFSWTDGLETRELSPRTPKSRPGSDGSKSRKFLDHRPELSRSTVDFTLNGLMSSLVSGGDDELDRMTPWELTKLRGFKSRESSLKKSRDLDKNILSNTEVSTKKVTRTRKKN